MDTSLISVIIPVYNVEEYLKECIDSIINQTYNNLEIILVDDGSTDNSGAICDEYATIDNRIKVIHKENGGQAGARNLGVDVSNGEYITFIDSDDCVAIDYLEYLYLLSTKYNSDIVSCGFNSFSENISYESNEYDDIQIKTYSKEKFIDYIFYAINDITCNIWAHLYHKSLKPYIKFQEGIIYEDLAIAHLLYDKCKTPVHSTAKKYFYRIRENSTMTIKLHPKRNSMFIVNEQIIDFAKENPIYLDSAKARYVSGCIDVLKMLMYEPKKHRDEIAKIISLFKKYYKDVLKDKNCPRNLKIKTLATISTPRSLAALRLALKVKNSK